MIVRQCTVSVVETVSDAGMIRYVWLSDVTLITTCLQSFKELVKIINLGLIFGMLIFLE